MGKATSVGTYLRQARIKKGVSLKWLSIATGLAISTISRIERDQYPNSYAAMLRLAQELNITAEVKHILCLP